MDIEEIGQVKQIVLMYHDIYRIHPSESGFQNPTAIKYKVKADRFEDHVAAIDEYLRRYKLSADTVDFTFDDGGVSFLTLAAPILEKYGFRGKFYISTDYIGSKGFLDASQIKVLRSRGHTVGSHSHSHPERMSAMTDQEIADEWNISQRILTDILNDTSKYASIPNGYSSRKVLDAMYNARISNIDTSATTTTKTRFKNAIIRGRYAVTDDFTTKQVMQIISSPSFRLRKAIRWHILSFAKAILGDTYLSLRTKLSK